MRCDEATLLGQVEGHGVAVSRRCRCWDCDLCRPINQAKVRQLVVELWPTSAVTLTVLSHWFDSPDERARRLRAEFSAFRRIYCKRTGDKLDFVAVFEATKLGEPHLHIAMRCSDLSAVTLRQLLSKWMAKAIGAPNVDVQPAYNPAGWANYMSKDPVLFAGCRRYWTSRGWRIAKYEADAGFELDSVVRASLATVEQMAIAAGHVITERSPLRLKTLRPFAAP